MFKLTVERHIFIVYCKYTVVKTEFLFVMHPIILNILSRFLTKQQMRYIDRNPSKVRASAGGLIQFGVITLFILLIGFYVYGAYTLLIIFNLSVVLGYFWLIHHKTFNSQDAKNRPEAYDHVAGMGFAATYGLAFFVVFILVLVLSIAYVHGVVYE